METLEERAKEMIKGANYYALLNLASEYEVFDKSELLKQLIDVVGAVQVATDLGFEI